LFKWAAPGSLQTATPWPVVFDFHQLGFDCSFVRRRFGCRCCHGVAVCRLPGAAHLKRCESSNCERDDSNQEIALHNTSLLTGNAKDFNSSSGDTSCFYDKSASESIRDTNRSAWITAVVVQFE